MDHTKAPEQGDREIFNRRLTGMNADLKRTVLRINMESKPEITQFDFGDGDVSLVVELPVTPFGTAPIATDDASNESRRILEVLIHGWDDLWPDMLDKLQESMDSYGCGQKLGRDEFEGSISPMDPSCYMGDRSDYFLSLQFDEPPLWDFFLKGTKIVHYQPVF